MRLFSAHLDDLKWQDAVDYCALGLPEGTIRVYKEDFPSELERTVAAMANTSGGVIIIGATEDRKTTRATGLPGTRNAAGLTERVLNIGIGNIAPVLVPEVAVLLEPSSKHTKVYTSEATCAAQ